MKFLTPYGIATVKASSEIISSLSVEGSSQVKPLGKVEEWILNDKFPEQTVKIGAQLR
jgi:hypothetical protein